MAAKQHWHSPYSPAVQSHSKQAADKELDTKIDNFLTVLDRAREHSQSPPAQFSLNRETHAVVRRAVLNDPNWISFTPSPNRDALQAHPRPPPSRRFAPRSLGSTGRQPEPLPAEESDEECAWCPGSPTGRQGSDLMAAKAARQKPPAAPPASREQPETGVDGPSTARLQHQVDALEGRAHTLAVLSGRQGELADKDRELHALLAEEQSHSGPSQRWFRGEPQEVADSDRQWFQGQPRDTAKSAECNRLRIQVTELGTELESIRAAARLQKAVLSSRLSQLKQVQLAEASKTARSNSKLLNKLKQQLDEVTAAHSVLRTRFVSAKLQGAAALSHEVDKYNTEVDRMSARIGQLEHEREGEAARVEAAVHASQAKIDQQIAAIQRESDQKMDALRGSRAAVDGELEAARRELEQAREAHAELKAAKLELEAARGELRLKDELIEQMKSHEAEAAQLGRSRHQHAAPGGLATHPEAERTREKVKQISLEALESPDPSREPSRVQVKNQVENWLTGAEARKLARQWVQPFGASKHYKFNVQHKDDRLSSGLECEVYRAKNTTSGEVVALKCVEMYDLSEYDVISEEFRIMKACEGHPHVIQLRGIYHDRNRGLLQIAMEMMIGGTLFDAVNKRGRLSHPQTCDVLRNVSSALAHMHNLDFIHRDVKPENILLRRIDDLSSVVLSDFETAIPNSASSQAKIGEVGTAGYISPEMLCLNDYDFKTDIWSLGVVMFVMLIGGTPFPQSNRKEARETTCAGLGPAHQVRLQELQPKAVELLEWMLQPDPVNRASSIDVCQHGFVSGMQSPESAHHSPSWRGAKHKWAQVRNAVNAVFSLRRTFNKRPKKPDNRPRSNTAAPAPPGESRLMDDKELSRFINDESQLNKKYGSRNSLTTNENCDIYTAKRKKGGERVVIKVVECDPYDLGRKEKLTEEIRIFASMGKHSSIVTFFEAFFNSYECYTVMAWAKGGELFDRVQRHGVYSESEAQLAFAKLADALCHVHSRGVIHRDIKPESEPANCLTTDRCRRYSACLARRPHLSAALRL